MTDGYSPPRQFLRRMQDRLGAEFASFLHAYDCPYCRGIRMRDAGMAFPPECGEPVPWAAEGRYLSPESLLGAGARHEAGAFYLQEPSAMAPAAALDPQPGECVLDLCAAPGGKSTQIAERMRGRGVLVSNEPYYARARILSGNIERMGIRNAIVTCSKPEEIGSGWNGCFDRILVDAPCSGEGMFRRHPETVLQWTEEAGEICAARQKRILLEAVRMLRPGGILVYSTCTFNPAENEDVVNWCLRETGELTSVPFTLGGIEACGGMMYLWPHRIRGEGHFLAKMMKTGDGPAIRRARAERENTKKRIPKELSAFMRELFPEAEVERAICGPGGCLIPPEIEPPLEGVRVLRRGVHLGQTGSSCFFPDHALSHAWPCEKKFDVGTAEAAAYLRGEPLICPADLQGYYTVCYHQEALGWGKASGGVMKNHYPKGLRKAHVQTEE